MLSSIKSSIKKSCQYPVLLLLLMVVIFKKNVMELLTNETNFYPIRDSEGLENYISLEVLIFFRLIDGRSKDFFFATFE